MLNVQKVLFQLGQKKKWQKTSREHKCTVVQLLAWEEWKHKQLFKRVRDELQFRIGVLSAYSSPTLESEGLWEFSQAETT